MKKLLASVAFLTCVFGQIQAQTQIQTADLDALYKKTSFNGISIHDPSVFWDESSKKFYIYGSHYCGASSSDLRNWSNWGMWGDYYNTKTDAYAAFTSNPTHKLLRCLPNSTTPEEVTLGSFNASEFCSTYATIQVGDRQPTTARDWVKGDQWAPDIIYNPHMKKYCYYLSLNGDNWASVVVMMTSDKVTGPFTYQGPVVFGGFNGQTYSGKSVNYKNTDLEVVLGTQSSLPGRYDKKGDWGKFWPNCIDPCVFFDEEGELWMTYGSWSGGIWMLKLDKETGLRDYTTTYAGTASSVSTQQTSDAYFGKLIAGGCYVSGEGSYIQHIGNYYYLFMSYGFFDPDGGYEMRVFRSENPTGPYVDASGNVATYSNYQMNYGPKAATNKGMRLFAAMNNWGTMTVGECAQGHNSACVDDKGRAFLVCHTKFNNGSKGHAVRAYQLYTNKQGWLCAAPFQFNGETTTDVQLSTSCKWTAEDVAGDYHLLLHPYKLNYSSMQESKPVDVRLTADGKIRGDKSGTWKFIDEGKSYIQLTMSSVTYSGVLVEQTLENNTAKTLCITAVCCTSGNASCGVSVWAYKLQPQSAIAYNYQKYGSYFKSLLSVNQNKCLMFDPEESTNIEWSSSNPDVFSNTGAYNPTTEDVDITLTARLTSGNYYWEKVFTPKVKAAVAIEGDPYSDIVAYYDFNESPNTNSYNTEQKTTIGRSSTSGASAPAFEADWARFGNTIHTFAGAQGLNSYVRMDNPLKDCTNISGFTVGMWVKRFDANQWDALCSFFGSKDSKAEGSRLFFTGNCYLGFNDNAGNWFDINNPNTRQVDKITPGEWKFITVTYSAANGYTIYIDGTKQTILSSAVSTSADKIANFNHQLVINHVTTSDYFYLGQGSFWGSADVRYDDLIIYSRELSAADVKGLATVLNRVNDMTPEGVKKATAIESVATDDDTPSSDNAIYDLQGRRLTTPAKGFYIQNGKKYLKR